MKSTEAQLEHNIYSKKPIYLKTTRKYPAISNLCHQLFTELTSIRLQYTTSESIELQLSKANNPGSGHGMTLSTLYSTTYTLWSIKLKDAHSSAWTDGSSVAAEKMRNVPYSSVIHEQPQEADH